MNNSYYINISVIERKGSLIMNSSISCGYDYDLGTQIQKNKSRLQNMFDTIFKTIQKKSVVGCFTEIFQSIEILLNNSYRRWQIWETNVVKAYQTLATGSIVPKRGAVGSNPWVDGFYDVQLDSRLAHNGDLTSSDREVKG